MQALYPAKASPSVTTSSITVSSYFTDAAPSSKGLSTPELDRSPSVGSPSSLGSPRRSKRPPPVKILQYPPSPNFDHTERNDRRPSLISLDSEFSTSQDDIPIYFGGLPQEFSYRRPSFGIPDDASFDYSGFPSSLSSTFDIGPKPRSLDNRSITRKETPIQLDSPRSLSVPRLGRSFSQRDSKLSGLGLIIDRPVSAQSYRTPSPVSAHARLRGTPTLSNSLQASKLRQEVDYEPRARTTTGESAFTISAYAGLPSDTPPTIFSSEFQPQLLLDGESPRLDGIPLAYEQNISPKSHSPFSRITSKPDRPAKPQRRGSASSTHAEASFFLSQMDDYLAQHTDTYRERRSEPSDCAISDNLRLKPSLALKTLNLPGSVGSYSAVEQRGRGANHARGPSAGSWISDLSVAKPINQSTTIQLSIDQESFRRVQPVFQFARFRSAKAFQPKTGRPRTAEDYGGQASTMFGHTGCLEFRMATKELWPFHYSTFEPSPTLRKIAVNGDQRYDYLKRNATLNLKSNGVYEISGSEDKGRIEWKFEYVVEDRRSESSGNAIGGEKVVMPLTFSCSPDFLDRSRAMKTGLVNRVRRTVVASVNSHKVPPPSLPSITTAVSPLRSAGKTPILSVSRPNTAQSNLDSSPTDSLSPHQATRPLRSKISATLLPFSKNARRPTTAQPSLPSPVPCPPVTSNTMVMSKRSIRRRKPSFGRRDENEENKHLLTSGQRSAGLIAKLTPKSIMNKRPATASGYR